jgi:6-phosphofructokinase 1
VLKVFEAHNIRYFFYAGGNDSQDTANKISKLAQEKGYELRVIGIPKTIDNDLVATDHCPGYGSVIKHISTLVREMACDHESMGQGDMVSILEVMGRNAGWIAAGASLAKRRDKPNDPPHLIYLPEVAFNPEKFKVDVQRVLSKERYCMIVVGEGLIDAAGNYVHASSGATDAFGHNQLGGAGDYLRELVETTLGVKARTAKFGISQRSAATHVSKTDSDEAVMAGQAAVKAAISGVTDKMVTLIRSGADHYVCETGLTDLEEVANGVKSIPTDWINEDGTSMSFQFVKYASPLIQGEVSVPYDNGLPTFASLSKTRIFRLLDAYQPE